jgi:AraC family transcriptional activator of pobA
MNNSNINIFYDQYVDGHHPPEDGFLGHFDLLLWKDLQKDLSACKRFQRKPFYKIALVNGNAIYQSKSTQIPISGYNIIFSAPLSRLSFTTNDEQFEGKYCVCVMPDQWSPVQSHPV